MSVCVCVCVYMTCVQVCITENDLNVHIGKA